MLKKINQPFLEVAILGDDPKDHSLWNENLGKCKFSSGKGVTSEFLNVEN